MPDVIDPSPLTVVNVFLGAVCVAMVTAVVIAALRDWRERRRWRAMVPDTWPPAGVDPLEVDADALAAPGAPPGRDWVRK